MQGPLANSLCPPDSTPTACSSLVLPANTVLISQMRSICVTCSTLCVVSMQFWTASRTVAAVMLLLGCSGNHVDNCTIQRRAPSPVPG